MSLFSSPSDADPFGFLVSCGAVASATTGSAWLQAMLDAEAALTAAMADVGLVPQDAAAAIGEACQADRFDVDAVFEAAALDGNPVIPLVSLLRAAVGEPAAAHVHRGATSQDIVDTAAMLVVRRSTRLLTDELGQLVDDVGSARAAASRCRDDRPHAHAARRADDVRGPRHEVAERYRRRDGDDCTRSTAS